MANHLTPDELSKELGIDRQEVIRVCIEGRAHLPGQDRQDALRRAAAGARRHASGALNWPAARNRRAIERAAPALSYRAAPASRTRPLSSAGIAARGDLSERFAGSATETVVAFGFAFLAAPFRLGRLGLLDAAGGFHQIDDRRLRRAPAPLRSPRPRASPRAVPSGRGGSRSRARTDRSRRQAVDHLLGERELGSFTAVSSTASSISTCE